MKHLRLFAVALAALAMVSLTGCQAISEHSQLYQMKQAEKAAKARDLAEAEAFNSMRTPSPFPEGASNALSARYRKEKAEWEKANPGVPFSNVPWSAAPGAKRVEINGKYIYCAPTETGDIHCE